MIWSEYIAVRKIWIIGIVPHRIDMEATVALNLDKVDEFYQDDVVVEFHSLE